MDRKTLLAMALCLGIFVAWQKLYLDPHTKKTQPTTVAQSSSETSGQSNTQESPTSPATQAKPVATLVKQPQENSQSPTEYVNLETPQSVATLKDRGALFSNWTLNHYKFTNSDQSIDLKEVTNLSENITFAFDSPEYEYLNSVAGVLDKKNGVVTWTYEDKNILLKREFTSNSSLGVLEGTITATFKTSQVPAHAFLTLRQSTLSGDQQERDHRLIYFTKDSIERVLPKDVSEIKSIPTPVDYIGVESRYFLLAVVPETDARGLLQPLGTGVAQSALVYPVPPSGFQTKFKVFLGPKELSFLRAINPKLDHTVDFGWFTIVAYPLLKMLKFFYGLVHNYGIAIILLTVVIKLLLYPLTYKSAKSMREMAKIQPQIQRLRDKHKDDKEALNREMLTLMRSNGYNPMAGCMPIVLQMPIFFALYRVLYGSIELYGAPFMFWIKDLSAHDPWYVTPVLLTLTMFLQQKLTPTTSMDPAQQKMLQFMPVIFGVFMIMLPSGLTLYMLINAVMSIFQQLILNKKLDLHYGPLHAAKPRSS